jgi:hypothetical protein
MSLDSEKQTVAALVAKQGIIEEPSTYTQSLILIGRGAAIGVSAGHIIEMKAMAPFDLEIGRSAPEFAVHREWDGTGSKKPSCRDDNGLCRGRSYSGQAAVCSMQNQPESIPTPPKGRIMIPCRDNLVWHF